MTDEGATDLPNGAEEVLRRGDSREPPFLFLQGKVGYQIAPSSDPASPAHLPPKGKAFGGERAAGRLKDYYGPHVYPLTWEPSFAKMLFSIFFPENAFQIGVGMPEVTALRPVQT